MCNTAPVKYACEASHSVVPPYTGLRDSIKRFDRETSFKVSGELYCVYLRSCAHVLFTV